MANPPRIWISNEAPAKDEIVRVRAQVVHVMESGLRQDEAGNPIPRDTLERFEARLNEALLLDWQPETAVAQNPYIEFTFRARESGVLKMVWSDASGIFAEAEKTITLS
ncbi:thiosulfate oxidation carrier complex protein SoxZ [Pseudogemmobacter humi]|uniref:Sulfur oxidation protein SoxZ n=1 Tax=Pseudogemmobacter humi TaxID=2483812 RepID=A0A3P5XGE7_9RHOB|nr:thiosulfate oxidation carrier complex protein SoxZ [Pseudogemmobacter humi]VDC29231.1 sulfur oxidation protein SoxZ [Pseudogemmobacter humi]